MFGPIAADYKAGLINSCRFDLFIREIIRNEKLRRLFLKITKYNFILYCLPYFIIELISYSFETNLQYISEIIYYPITFFSAIFHLLHYLYLVNIIITNIF